MRSILIIHWDDAVDADVMKKVADEAFDLVADHVHDNDSIGDAWVSATLMDPGE